MPLLGGLSKVKWSRLRHAYGPAEDLPDLLRALADPESAPPALRAEAKRAGRELREHVEWKFWGNVFHQGSRWEATASVVPFLVEILRDGPDDASLRRFLISYLHHLAVGYPEDEFPARIDHETFSEWERDSYLAVERAIDAILPFLDAEDEDTALEAIALVASFPRCAPKTVPLLREIARTRSDQRAAHALISLSRLAGADAVEEDAARLLRAGDRAVAIQAACAVVLADPKRASGEAIAILTAPLGDVAGTHSVHAESLTRLVGRSLGSLPREHVESAVDAIALQHRGARPLERTSLTGSLLNLVFEGQRAPASAAGLTPPQRRAVEAIRDFGAFKIGDAIFANYSLLLRDWGLPDSPEALDDWLAGRS